MSAVHVRKLLGEMRPWVNLPGLPKYWEWSDDGAVLAPEWADVQRLELLLAGTVALRLKGKDKYVAANLEHDGVLHAEWSEKVDLWETFRVQAGTEDTIMLCCGDKYVALDPEARLRASSIKINEKCLFRIGSQDGKYLWIQSAINDKFLIVKGTHLAAEGEHHKNAAEFCFEVLPDKTLVELHEAVDAKASKEELEELGSRLQGIQDALLEAFENIDSAFQGIVDNHLAAIDQRIGKLSEPLARAEESCKQAQAAAEAAGIAQSEAGNTLKETRLHSQSAQKARDAMELTKRTVDESSRAAQAARGEVQSLINEQQERARMSTEDAEAQYRQFHDQIQVAVEEAQKAISISAKGAAARAVGEAVGALVDDIQTKQTRVQSSLDTAGNLAQDNQQQVQNLLGKLEAAEDRLASLQHSLPANGSLWTRLKWLLRGPEHDRLLPDADVTE